MNKNFLWILAAVLILIGITKPNFNLLINKPVVVDNIVIITPPENSDLRAKCKLIIDILKNSSLKEKTQDAQRLSDLYMDLATLIELDGENEVVKTTEEIRQANSLSGLMLRMNIKNKYPGLSDASQVIIGSQIGDDIVPLDAELRKKAVEAFRALAWAVYEGSK